MFPLWIIFSIWITQNIGYRKTRVVNSIQFTKDSLDLGLTPYPCTSTPSSRALKRFNPNFAPRPIPTNFFPLLPSHWFINGLFYLSRDANFHRARPSNLVGQPPHRPPHYCLRVPVCQNSISGIWGASTGQVQFLALAPCHGVVRFRSFS